MNESLEFTQFDIENTGVTIFEKILKSDILKKKYSFSPSDRNDCVTFCIFLTDEVIKVK